MNILEAIKSGKEIKTESGLPVRIICTNAKSFFPIIALVQDRINNETPLSYTEEGVPALNIHGMCLVVNSKKVTTWINIYKYNNEITTGGCTYDSERAASAKGKTSASYVCTKSIEIEV